MKREKEDGTMAHSDELIKSTLVDQLYLDIRVDASQVKVEVKDGIATLRGEVPTYHAYRSAYRDALQVGGVKSVINQLVVRYPAGAVLPTDAGLLSSVKEVLARNPDIAIEAMDIEVDGGQIILRGSVDAYWKKLYAEELVSSEPGVVGITNHLTVVPGSDVVDRDIAAAIVRSLEGRAAVSADDVEVQVEGGRVVLEGAVSGWAAVQAAQEAAEYKEGVIDIVNKLTVAKRQ